MRVKSAETRAGCQLRQRFGEVLRGALEEKQLTVSELAQKLEIVCTQVYDWLRRKRIPPFLVMQRIMEITQKDEMYFFGLRCEGQDRQERCSRLLDLYDENGWL